MLYTVYVCMYLLIVPLDEVPKPLVDACLEKPVQRVGVASVHIDLVKYVKLHSKRGRKVLYLISCPWLL